LGKAVDEMKTADDKYRVMVDAIPTLAWSSQADGSAEFFNARWHDYTGLSPQEARAWRWRVTIHPDDLEKSLKKWRALLSSGEPGELEARLRRGDGVFRWFLFRSEPVRDERGDLVRWYGTNTDIEDRKRAESLLAAEKRTLEMIASGAPRTDILEALCNTIAAHAGNIISAVMMMDTDVKRLWPAAGPRLSKGWIETISPLKVGSDAGSCGSAALRKECVIVSDIATDPLWSDYRDFALGHGLRAAWPQPLLSKNRQVLGTFGMYYTEPRTPSDADLRRIEGAGHVAVIAIEGVVRETASNRRCNDRRNSVEREISSSLRPDGSRTRSLTARTCAS
jgi:PAS domain S-box-containing protein